MAKYNSEFKLLVSKNARTYSEVVREYDVRVQNVKTWMQEFKQYGYLI